MSTVETAAALPSWRDGPAKQAIVEFVDRVCGRDGSPPVPAEERVATFDNDGTLWCEQPMPIQLDFILRRLVEMAEADETLRARQPWKAAFERDYDWLRDTMYAHYAGDDTNVRVVAAGVLAAFDGISVEHFEARADTFLRGAQHRPLVEATSSAPTRRWWNCLPTWRRTDSRTTSPPAGAATSCGRSARTSMASRASA
jgi:hypothetical protein